MNDFKITHYVGYSFDVSYLLYMFRFYNVKDNQEQLEWLLEALYILAIKEYPYSTLYKLLHDDIHYRLETQHHLRLVVEDAYYLDVIKRVFYRSSPKLFAHLRLIEQSLPGYVYNRGVSRITDFQLEGNILLIRFEVE